MSTTILHISDTHSGLRAGLIAPETELNYENGETNKIELSASSLYVLECYQRLIDTTVDFAEHDPVIVIHTGDITHGSTFAEYLYSGRESHQVVIAVKALAELRRIPTLTAFRLLYGSAAHDFGMSSATEQVANDIAEWGYNLWCGSYGVETIEDIQLDYAHRGPGLSHGEDRTMGARRYAIRLVRAMLERGKRAPDVILRGHIHRKCLESLIVPWGKDGKQTIISVAAPLCGQNEYARNFSQNAPFSEVGGALFRIHDGHIVEHLAATWEKENRYHVEGTIAHLFGGITNPY